MPTTPLSEFFGWPPLTVTAESPWMPAITGILAASVLGLNINTSTFQIWLLPSSTPTPSLLSSPDDLPTPFGVLEDVAP